MCKCKQRGGGKKGDGERVNKMKIKGIKNKGRVYKWCDYISLRDPKTKNNQTTKR